MSTVLVTGGSGYVGIHVIVQLLQKGHRVRTTVRKLSRADDVRAMLKEAKVEAGDALTFFEAELMSDQGWKEAVAGCDYVMHVASPFPLSQPRDENELIVPAREGTLRVLRVARDARVKRVVLTSSFAAVGYGQPVKDTPFTEEDWTNTETPGVKPYVKSKTIAERAAWDFIEKEGGATELTVLNPVGIFGPVFSSAISTSVEPVKLMINGMPAVPHITFGVVDVRDLADLHVRAMTSPAAKGERFIAVGDNGVSMLDGANELRKHLGDKGQRLPYYEIPDWIVRLLGYVSGPAASAAQHLGPARIASSAKAERLLGWKSRGYKESIDDTADSLFKYGVVNV